MRVHRLIQVGAGGIGQFFAQAACKVMAYKSPAPYIIYDGDEYEHGNRHRQDGDIGSNKAEWLASSLYEDATPVSIYIEDDDHFASIMATDGHAEHAQVVAICVDNDATRHHIYHGIEQTEQQVCVIDMANEEHHGDVIVHTFSNGQWLPNHPFDAYPQLKNPGDRPPQAYCQTQAPTSPQLVTTNMQAACIGARVLLDLLSGEKIGTQIMFDHQAMRMWNPDA